MAQSALMLRLGCSVGRKGSRVPASCLVAPPATAGQNSARRPLMKVRHQHQIGPAHVHLRVVNRTLICRYCQAILDLQRARREYLNRAVGQRHEHDLGAVAAAARPAGIDPVASDRGVPSGRALQQECFASAGNRPPPDIGGRRAGYCSTAIGHPGKTLRRSRPRA